VTSPGLVGVPAPHSFVRSFVRSLARTLETRRTMHAAAMLGSVLVRWGYRSPPPAEEMELLLLLLRLLLSSAASFRKTPARVVVVVGGGGSIAVVAAVAVAAAVRARERFALKQQGVCASAPRTRGCLS
jgi:hypothetical protein